MESQPRTMCKTAIWAIHRYYVYIRTFTATRKLSQKVPLKIVQQFNTPNEVICSEQE